MLLATLFYCRRVSLVLGRAEPVAFKVRVERVMAVCEELINWQIELDMDELSINSETAATILSESPQFSTPAFPSEVSPPQKRKSEECFQPIDLSEYNPYEMYHISVNKLLNPPLSPRRTEMPLHRSVRIRNVLKHLEHDISFSNYHAVPPSKRISLDEQVLEEQYSECTIMNATCDNINTCENISNISPNALFSWKESADQRFGSSSSAISSHEIDMDVGYPVTDKDDIEADCTHSATFTKEAEYKSLNSCSFDHQLHSSSKDGNHAIEDLDTIMQVLVGI